MAELSLERGLDVLNKRTRTVRIAIFAYLATSAMAALSDLGEITGLVDLEAAAPDSLSLAAGFSLLAFLVVMIASAVVIAMWIHRAHSNLRAALIDGLEFTPGWAVGWYFVPIANLFKPFQAMRELWTMSHIEATGYSSDNDPRLAIWWGLWVVGSIASNISPRFDASAGEGAATTGLMLSLLGRLLLAAAAWFLLQIVVAIDSAQRSILGVEATFA